MGKELFTIFHFNDVYDIQEKMNGAGGIARFQAYLKELRKQHPNNILLFSGDCYGPSKYSHVLKGQQMVQSLNHLKIDAACYGNHQFDFGRQHCLKLAKVCNFKWLLGNVKDKNFPAQNDVYRNLGDGLYYKILQVKGLKIGVFGVVGKSFKGQLKSQPSQTKKKIQHSDEKQYSNLVCQTLKEEGCDIIVALTHMKNFEDQQLAIHCPNIDIILGGHQHQKIQKYILGTPLIKSGSNFQNIGVIKVYKKDPHETNQIVGKNFNFVITIQDVKIDKQKYNNDIVEEVKRWFLKSNTLDPVIGFTSVKLDIQRADYEQTNVGNFIADVAYTYLEKQVSGAIINSGCIFPKKDIQPGKITRTQIDDFHQDPVVIKLLYGHQIEKILKNACQELRLFEYVEKGNNRIVPQFIFVAGIKFKYKIYPKQVEVTQIRIECNQQKKDGHQLQRDRLYPIAIKLNFFNSIYKRLQIHIDKSNKYDNIPKPTLIKILLKVFDVKNFPNYLHKKTSQKQNNYNGSSPSKLFRTNSANQNIQQPTLFQLNKVSQPKLSKQDKALNKFIQKLKSKGFQPTQQLNLVKKVSERAERIANEFYKRYSLHQNLVQINPQVDGRMKRLK